MHNERCPSCKDSVERMLRAIYGEVRRNYRIELGTKPEDYMGTDLHAPLSIIFSALQNHRGFTEFVRAGYVDADYFVPHPGFIVEFDESQHFTEARKIALSNYSAGFKIGFPREEWIGRCDEINAHDNDPPFRDEQRAWYDTLRDFLPEIKGFLPTVRLYAREREWCRMDPEKQEDVEEFKKTTTHQRISMTDSAREVQSLDKHIPSNSVLDDIIRFEYLANIIKLQYLLDCTNGVFNKNSLYLQDSGNTTRLLNNGGIGFRVYLNMFFRNQPPEKRYKGPLFSNRDPWKYQNVKEINQINNFLKIEISTSDDWFALFCEITLVKTSLHELTADVHDPAITKYFGYPDLEALYTLSKELKISGAKLRDFVVHCIRLGINPSENHDGIEQEINHLSACSYAELQIRRHEWIGTAWSYINRIKLNMNSQDLKKVMQWNKSALCAYETGPVFIRKDRGLLLPRIARSFDKYKKWDQTQLRDNLFEIIGEHVNFVIENYQDHFHNQQSVKYLAGNNALASEVTNAGEQLNSMYRQIYPHSERVASPDSPSHEIPLIHFFLQQTYSQKKTEDKTGFFQKSTASRDYWTESSFRTQLLGKTGSQKKVKITKKLIDWAYKLDLGENWPIKEFIPFNKLKPRQQLFGVTINGRMTIKFKEIPSHPPFDKMEKRQEFIDRINQIPGTGFSITDFDNRKNRSFEIDLLDDQQNMDAFLTFGTWFFNELRNEPAA